VKEQIIKAGDTWRNSRGEVRTIVRVDRLPNYSEPGKFRRRVVYVGADQVETSCRRVSFRKWIREGAAVVIGKGID
jgi:hypothetical protein